MQPNLLEYSRGLLNPREAEGVRAHLETCALCRAVMESEIELAGKLATMPSHEPKADVWALVHARIRAERAPARATVFEKIRTAVSRKVAVATATVAVAATITLVAVNPWQAPAPKPGYDKTTSIKQAVTLMQVQPIADDSVVDTTDAMMKVLEDDL